MRRADSLTIIFETHSTSLDNEARLASGHADTDLSPGGERQAIELGARRRADRLDVVYASDLRRSWRTAEIAFATSSIAIVRDARLRECDYGLLSRHPVAEIDALRDKAINDSFPGGESYAQVVVRVAAWLDDTRSRGHQQVLVIGHRATQYSLEHLVVGVPLVEAVRRSFRWQPGWVYELP